MSRPQSESGTEQAGVSGGAGESASEVTGPGAGDGPHLLLMVTTCSLRGHLSGPLAQLLVSPGGAGLR